MRIRPFALLFVCSAVLLLGCDDRKKVPVAPQLSAADAGEVTTATADAGDELPGAVHKGDDIPTGY